MRIKLVEGRIKSLKWNQSDCRGREASTCISEDVAMAQHSALRREGKQWPCGTDSCTHSKETRRKPWEIQSQSQQEQFAQHC